MSITPLANIQIEDSDIDEIERLLGDIIFDEARRNVIKRLDTFDVQAFPGTGKTTVLVAKLAILAKKWSYSNRGICVLSHTNVAREEIESRLGSTDVGRKLLSYPHFIGTLHAFANTFIGLPWLKSNGYTISTIDTEITLQRRWGKLSYGARRYLEIKKFSEYACESNDFPAKLDIKCSEQTTSYKNIKSVVEQSFQDGFYTYDEMLYIARYAQAQFAALLPQAIQMRFPILLVDEAQDTSALQWEIIDAAFPDEASSIVNSLGDSNQAIFQSYSKKEEKVIFPRRSPTPIENSKRFSSKIANLVNPLSISRGSMTGEYTEFSKNDSKHTIFLYENDNIASVLPAYAEHILECFTDEELLANAKFGCHAVGMVHKAELHASSDKHFPKSVIDYWQEYNPSITGKEPSLRRLVEYFRIGEAEKGQTHDIGKLIQSVARGLCRYINTNSDVRISVSSNAFASILKNIPIIKQEEFRASFKLIADAKFSTEDEWSSVVEMTRELIDEQFGIKRADSNYFQWVSPGQSFISENDAKHTSLNCYLHISPETGRNVNIQLGSIHSVKGRTHLSTLVLETFWNDHNIESLLSWLYAEPPNKETGVQIAKRLKCHYVALTRAKGLICIAIPKVLVNDTAISKLQNAGWAISLLS